MLFESLSYVLMVTCFREIFGLFITSGFRSIFKKLGLDTERPWKLIFWVFVLAFAASGIDLLLVLGLEEISGWSGNEEMRFGIYCFRTLLFIVWSLLYFGLKDMKAARDKLIMLSRAESAARDAEVLMLRAQVSPHFLFNAFNTILADIGDSNPKLVSVVMGLSDYFRYSLTNHDEVFVTIGQEYDAICSYLTVEKARFGDELEVDSYLDPSVRDIHVPGIFLQPLVENALKYGHMTSPSPLRLRLHLRPHAHGGLAVEVANSGEWVEHSDRVSANGESGGQGLTVLRRRLELLYPGKHTVEVIQSPENHEVVIRIVLIYEE